MLKSFLLITLRKILKNKGSSYLNIIGQTLGIATCLFIFHFIYFELNYDSKIVENDVFRVESEFYDNEELSYRDARTTTSAAPFLGEEFPEITDYTRLISYSEEGTGLFRKKKNDSVSVSIYLPKVFYAEQSILDVFDLALEVGNTTSALNKPNSILLSRKMAFKFFGKELEADESIIGKKLKSPGLGSVVKEFTITAIFADRSDNTHLKFDALVAKEMATINNGNESKGNINTYSYVKIKNHESNLESLASQLNNFDSKSSRKFKLAQNSPLNVLNQK